MHVEHLCSFIPAEVDLVNKNLDNHVCCILFREYIQDRESKLILEIQSDF